MRVLCVCLTLYVCMHVGWKIYIYCWYVVIFDTYNFDNYISEEETNTNKMFSITLISEGRGSFVNEVNWRSYGTIGK